MLFDILEVLIVFSIVLLGVAFVISTTCRCGADYALGWTLVGGGIMLLGWGFYVDWTNGAVRSGAAALAPFLLWAFAVLLFLVAGAVLYVARRRRRKKQLQESKEHSRFVF